MPAYSSARLGRVVLSVDSSFGLLAARAGGEYVGRRERVDHPVGIGRSGSGVLRPGMTVCMTAGSEKCGLFGLFGLGGRGVFPQKREHL